MLLKSLGSVSGSWREESAWRKQAFGFFPLKNVTVPSHCSAIKNWSASWEGTATCRFFGDVIFGEVKCVHVTSSQDQVVHLNRMSPGSNNLSNGAAVVHQLQLGEVSSCLSSTDSCATVSYPTLHAYFNVKMRKTWIKCRIKNEH